MAIWNVRWLTNPRTEKAKGKRAQLLRLTDRGAVAMIQETHWDGEAAATWGSGILPHVEVVRSLACAGPQGGLQGGVAILCPGPARVEARRELVPGCAVEATITGLPGASAVTYISLYLPPRRQAEVITE